MKVVGNLVAHAKASSEEFKVITHLVYIFYMYIKQAFCQNNFAEIIQSVFKIILHFRCYTIISSPQKCLSPCSGSNSCCLVCHWTKTVRNLCLNSILSCLCTEIMLFSKQEISANAQCYGCVHQLHTQGLVVF